MTPRQPLLAALLLDALDDLHRSLESLTAEEAEQRLAPFSTIAWTLAHIAQHVDSWVNAALAGQPRDSYLAGSAFSRGSAGEGVSWTAVQEVVQRVEDRARNCLARVSERQLAKLSTYQGSMDSIRGKPITGSYRLARLAAHIYYHIGDINSVRAAQGFSTPDFPSHFPATLAAATAQGVKDEP